MVKLNAQDASFLALEGPAAPMHIAFLLTFRMPDKASVDYMQKLHDRLMRFPVEVAPFNLRLKQHERLPTMRPELEVDEAIDLEYHLRHEALPWPGGERELGLAISRLHSLPLERSRPLCEFTLIEGLQAQALRVVHKDPPRAGRWRGPHASIDTDPGRYPARREPAALGGTAEYRSAAKGDQCNACHTRAEQGSYSESQIDIPGSGRWED